MLGYSKQSYYKRKSKDNRDKIDREEIRGCVMRIRQKLPKIGGRKLYHMLKLELIESGIKIGRDKFFDYLREERLLVPKLKRYYKTTDSKHWMKKYTNLLLDKVVDGPEQVWVADITYLRTRDNVYYLHLITDAYSKKIVGYNLADNLLSSSTLLSLKMAISNRIYKGSLIHHSDRGSQYCSREYTKALKAHGILISMTEKYDPYENAIAERVNGILKDEFGLGEIFESYYFLQLQVKESIDNYNELRVHFSINMLTPNQAHLQNEVKLKRWPKKFKEYKKEEFVF